MLSHLSLAVPLKTKFSNPTIDHNGRLLCKQKHYAKRDGTFNFYWQCTAENCKGSVITSRNTMDSVDMNLVEKKDHTCVVNVVEVINGKARQHYLQLVSEGVSRGQAYLQTWQDLDNPEIVGPDYIELNGRTLFATLIGLKSACQRREAANQPANPKTIAEFNLEGPHKEKYRKTRDGLRNFWLFTTGIEGKKIICFATKERLRLLNANADKCHIDGTWAVVPRLINGRNGQLVTIHCIHHHITVPCVFAFLPGKSAPVYQKFFETLKQAALNKGITLDLTKIMTDFETALRAELQRAWPNIMLKGCYFHYSACIYSHVKSEAQLRAWYMSEMHFAKFIRMIISLAYLPADQVIRIYNQVCEAYAIAYPLFFGHADTVKFLTYYEDQWLHNPHIPISHWNIFHERKVRTNNAVEGWHHRFHDIMGDHPTIWLAIENMQKEEEHYDMKIAQLNAGHVVVRTNGNPNPNPNFVAAKHKSGEGNAQGSVNYRDSIANRVPTIFATVIYPQDALNDFHCEDKCAKWSRAPESVLLSLGGWHQHCIQTARYTS